MVKHVKIILAMLAMMGVTPSYALAMLPGHFFGGVEGGLMNQSGNLQTTQVSIAGVPIAGDYNQKISDRGTIYGVLIGYQIQCKSMVVGLEASLNQGRIESAKNVAAYGGFLNVAYERGTHYSLSTRIGYQFPACFIPYIRLGVESGHDKLVINSLALNPNPTPVYDSFSAKQTQTHWLLGLGVELPLFAKQVSVRLEYDFLPECIKNYTDTVLPVQATHRYGPYAHVIKMQCVWNFL